MGEVIDMRKRFLWIKCSILLRRGDIKLPSSQKLLKELKEYVLYGNS